MSLFIFLWESPSVWQRLMRPQMLIFTARRYIYFWYLLRIQETKSCSVFWMVSTLITKEKKKILWNLSEHKSTETDAYRSQYARIRERLHTKHEATERYRQVKVSSFHRFFHKQNFYCTRLFTLNCVSLLQQNIRDWAQTDLVYASIMCTALMWMQEKPLIWASFVSGTVNAAKAVKKSWWKIS